MQDCTPENCVRVCECGGEDAKPQNAFLSCNTVDCGGSIKKDGE